MREADTREGAAPAIESVDDKIAAFVRRHAPDGKYTAADIRGVPPCPICGALARIVDGRLAQPCDQVKHSKALKDEAVRVAKLKLANGPVQQSLEIDDRRTKRMWWLD